MTTNDLSPNGVLAGFEHTMSYLRTVPLFPRGADAAWAFSGLLGACSYQGSPAFERGQWLACRHFSALRSLVCTLSTEAAA